VTPAAVADTVERARNAGAPAALRHEAFEELARSFEAMALASALGVLHDADDAREAVQDAFLAAWLKLDQLRAPEAFGGWLKRLVSTECSRRLRKRPARCDLEDDAVPVAMTRTRETPWPLARALAALPDPERQAILLFYVQGCTLQEIAAIAGASPATIGKRLYAARLKVRRSLPLSVRASVLRLGTRRLASGGLADYVGDYRFDKRPDPLVEIRPSRRSDLLVSRSGDQRHLLHFIGDDVLVTREFDGEGRFQRDGNGRITGFVYYEFGNRLGVARKM
jgi:RNA polymerase sigma factor (sigma-70 family)